MNSNHDTILPASRAARCATAVQFARNKLLRLYPVADGSADLPFSLRDQMEGSIWGHLAESSWQLTRKAALSQSGLPETMGLRLDEALVGAALKYAQGFYTVRAAQEAHRAAALPRFGIQGKQDLVLGSMVDIYINRISNHVIAQLRELGLNTKSAHIVHGMAIHHALRGYTAHLTDYGECCVNPRLGSSKGKTDDEISMEAARLENYWQERVGPLNALHDLTHNNRR